MVVRSKDGRIQIAVLEDGVLVEHYVARNQDASLIGNVYLGRVQNVLPSMEAAFVDIGRGRNAVLYSGEVDWEAAAENGGRPAAPHRTRAEARRPGARAGHEGPGRPQGRPADQPGLAARPLPRVRARRRDERHLAASSPTPSGRASRRSSRRCSPRTSGVIVRTAAEGATEEQLTLDVNRLTAQWADISHAAGERPGARRCCTPSPTCSSRSCATSSTRTSTRWSSRARTRADDHRAYLAQVAPDLLERVERVRRRRDPFDEFRVSRADREGARPQGAGCPPAARSSSTAPRR